ncbi:holo-[acyl-carrier-protein] synthase [Wolbachia pipientis]|uniref:Holo-[acyl-carrier-protein] synthase n=1 Tax=Wolbachia pipientis TaxID=955 RepID=A0A1E7QJ05_WOLPI|nr:holo-[acyl-carrier-protein] synthase [Wolbachia pipientis]OEY86357.1 holo-[acyl-carrier-protein] synthase [Wolbachia pipientis]
MIRGIGIDIVYIPRILKVMQKHGWRFLYRVYSQKEIDIGHRYDNSEIQAKYFSTRFAAKEAFVKALGTGFNNGIKMKDIEIHNDANGKPYILTSKDFICENNVTHLSISDDKEYATAFVVIETV